MAHFQHVQSGSLQYEISIYNLSQDRNIGLREASFGFQEPIFECASGDFFEEGACGVRVFPRANFSTQLQFTPGVVG
jgi:hypothetical protein